MNILNDIVSAGSRQFGEKIGRARANVKFKAVNTVTVRGNSDYYFMINNKSDIGIKRVFFNETFNFDGRNYSHSEDINHEFQKGLETGETQEFGMIPEVLSEWNKKLNLEIKAILN